MDKRESDKRGSTVNPNPNPNPNNIIESIQLYQLSCVLRLDSIHNNTKCHHGLVGFI